MTDYRFLVRGGTAAAIAALNEIVLSREIVYEIDTRKWKVGNGVDHYNTLPYYGSNLWQPLDPILSELADLSDPNAPRILMWEEDSSGGGFEWLTIGSGLALNNNTLTATSGGSWQPLDSILTELSDLSDPNAPRILMWEEDSSGGGFEWMSVGSGLALNNNVLTATGTSSGQAAIQYKDEGSNVGTSGAITSVNFTGSAVTASVAGTALTVNVTGGSSGGTVPLASAFSTIGAGIAVNDKTDRLQLVVSTFNTTFRGVMQNVPATPYTIDLTFSLTGVSGSGGTMLAGLALSNGTAYRTLGMALSAGQAGPRVYAWTTSAGVATVPYSSNYVSPIYENASLRITDDGTTRKFWISQNGKDFSMVFSEATNTAITPTKVGIICYNDDASAKETKLAVLNYLVTGSVLGDAA